MQIDTQDFLRLVELAKTLYFIDIEASNLRADYGSILCVSMKPYGKSPLTVSVTQPGNDQRVVREVSAHLEDADCWVTYYGKGFDIPFLNTRLLKWGLSPIQKKPHIDLYFQLKSKTLTSRRSQSHLLAWLGTPEQKMTVSADVWNQIVGDPIKHMPEMIKRCESDTKGLEALYERTKHLIADIKP